MKFKRFYQNNGELYLGNELDSNEVLLKAMLETMITKGFCHKDFVPMLLHYSSIVLFDYEVQKALE